MPEIVPASALPPPPVPPSGRPPFAHTSGPHSASVVLVGEAWGKDEALTRSPFVGASGQELTRMLTAAGIRRGDCLLTNVLALQPPNNDIEALCVTKKLAGDSYPLPSLAQGKYLHPAYLPELDRLREEIAGASRNLVIALGRTASWALLGIAGISSIRGTVAESTLVPGVKVLPTYHPSAVLRNWALRPIVLADLLKAKREAAFAEIRRPQRWVLVKPTLEEIRSWIAKHLPCSGMAVDIETKAGQITEVGFAVNPRNALVIPITKEGTLENYWPDIEDEIEAWLLIQQLLASPIPKIFQNGMYDLVYLRRMGLYVAQPREDTMLIHHSLFPEMQKGLAFMGSLYTNEPAWKLNYHRSREEELKANE